MCQTAYPSRINLSGAMITSLTAANLILAGTNIILNALLIYGLVKTKQSRKSSSRFIIYLSISDLNVGLLLQPLVIIILILYNKDQNCPAELTAQFLSFIFPQFSGVQIMLVAMDRFFRMKFLNQDRAYMIRKHGLLLVIFNAFLAIALATTSVLASTNKTFYLFNLILATMDLMVVLLIFMFYTFTYFSIHGYVRQAVKKDNQRKTNLPTISSASKTDLIKSVSTKSRLKTESALARTMLFILSSLSICYIPYLTLGVTWSYFQFQQKHTTPLMKEALSISTWWSFELVFLNSSINAAIFISRNQQIMELFLRIICKEQSMDTTTATELSSSAVNQTV